jgi:ABC-type polysaccharide/polyol phosphate transport system ATPase subunit
MKREQFDIAAGIVDRMDKLEKTIFKLQEIQNKKEYIIIASDSSIRTDVLTNKVLELTEGEIATEVFVQDILEYYINTLNLELNELRKNFDEI